MPDPARSIAKAPSPSAEVYDRLRQVEMNAQKDSSDLSSHEDICAERYAGIEKAFSEIKGLVTTLNGKVDVISNAQVASAAVAVAAAANGRPKWWQQLVGAAVVGLIGWMGATIFNMQTAAIKAAQDATRPAAQVTVNPTAPATPTQTYQVTPPAPAQPVPESPPG